VPLIPCLADSTPHVCAADSSLAVSASPYEYVPQTEVLSSKMGVHYTENCSCSALANTHHMSVASENPRVVRLGITCRNIFMQMQTIQNKRIILFHNVIMPFFFLLWYFAVSSGFVETFDSLINLFMPNIKSINCRHILVLFVFCPSSKQPNCCVIVIYTM